MNSSFLANLSVAKLGFWIRIDKSKIILFRIFFNKQKSDKNIILIYSN